MLWEALGAARDLGRVQQIAAVLVRYGFGGLVRRVGMAGALERAGKALHWREPEDLARLEPGQIFGLTPVQGLAGPLQRARHPDPPHQAAEAVAHQHRGNLLHTPQITGGTEGFP